MGLYNYARHLYDRGHAAVFLGAARVALTDAVERPLEGDAIEFFRGLLSKIEHLVKSGASHATALFGEYSLGRSSKEQTYRRFCLRQRSFLNPLNDLGPQSIGARDILTTPPMTVAIAEGPQSHGFFNQLKQEFISARYLHFEGTQDAHGSHFSDRDALLYDTLDYPVYGLATEQLKMAFRMAFSVLDKIAYFLNAYLRLGIPEAKVAFRTLWFTNQRAKDGLRPEFADRKNLPLRGLYWLSRELAEPADPSEDLRDCLEPEARELADIRNHLEHKYLKIHSLGFTDGGRAGPGRPLADTLSYSINRITFEKKCLKMVKLARAAIMYLSFAIHREEHDRVATRKSKGVKTGSIRLLHFPDEWKH
jgi:hypothetical protein